MVLTVVGTYREKIRVFGITLYSRTGAFSRSVPIDLGKPAKVDLPFGAVAAASIVGTTATATIGYGPLEFPIGSVALGGSKAFDLTLDKANEVKGVATLGA